MRPSGWRDWLRPSPAWDEVVYWALDLETTGLTPGKDRIVSIGMVPVRQGIIRFGERFSTLVKPAAEVAELPHEGIRAHHLLPIEYADAPEIGVLLPQLDQRLREGIAVLHHAPLDGGFLKDAYDRAGLSWPGLRAVDTIDLLLKAHRRQHQFNPHPPDPRTSLSEARAAAGLPAYTKHNALSDALATAELFLLLRYRLGICRLRELPVVSL